MTTEARTDASLERAFTTVPKNVAVSIMVCTRNRGNSVVMAIRTILANEREDFELVVIDQSTNDESVKAATPYLSDSRLRYIRSETKGLGRAHNIGLRESKGDIIAITDDDCETPPNWIDKIEDRFNRYPKVVLLFCNVLPAPHDPKEGFIPHYICQGERVMRNFRDKKNAHGIGAGMAGRREALLALGGFDEMMGPGALFPSFDDVDMALRVLAAGYEILETDSIAVVHYGFRTMAEGQQLIRRDTYAIGAGYAKMLKCGHWGVLPLIRNDLERLIFRPLMESLRRLEKPPILKRMQGLTTGFIHGLRIEVDRTRILYVEKI